MYQSHDINDSYYHHICVVAPEKDVLETDIVGTGCMTSLKRWWHNLFLLSYTSGRSCGFYNSSHAMKMERFRQFRKYRHRIHPMSKFRNCWDFLILHVFIMNKILFIMTSSFVFNNLPMALYQIGAFLELIIIADMYVNLKTGYIQEEAKRVILNTDKSLLNYCTKSLFIHLASAIPLHWLMFIKYGYNVTCGLCKANRFICVLEIMSVFSLYRVYETSAYWNQKRLSSKRNNFFKFFRIGTISFVTMAQFYDLSDALILLLFITKGEIDPKSILAVKAGVMYGTQSRESSPFYIGLDLNRIFKSFQLHSFGVAEKIFYLDKLTALFGFLLCKLFFAWTVVECYAFISPLVYPQDQFMQLRQKVVNVLGSQQLSDELNLKVRRYFDFRPTRFKALMRNNELVRMLPEVLKKEAKLSCYLKLVMRIPYFADLPLPLLVEIVLLLREEIYLRNAIVAEQYRDNFVKDISLTDFLQAYYVSLLTARNDSNWAQCPSINCQKAWVPAGGLMIVDTGVLAVYSKNNKEQGHLIDGDFFGGLSLVTDQELCMSYVVAVTTSTILLLEKLRFRNLMRHHTQLFLELKMQMKNRYQVRDLVAERRASQLSQPPPVKY